MQNMTSSRMRIIARYSTPSCWSCGGGERDGFLCGSCGAVLDVGRGKDEPDLFSILNLRQTYDVDATALNKAFKAAQRIIHPDRYALSGRERDAVNASAASALLNKASTVLRDPVARAMYMLERTEEGVDEENLVASPALLMDVLEKQEAVAEAEEVGVLHAMVGEADERLAEIQDGFVHALEVEGNVDAATEKVVEMRYWANIKGAALDGITVMEGGVPQPSNH